MRTARTERPPNAGALRLKPRRPAFVVLDDHDFTLLAASDQDLVELAIQLVLLTR
jgi:hypothetical protein